MNTLAADELRNVAKHLSAIIDCMAQARETLDDKDYLRYLEVMMSYLVESHPAEISSWATSDFTLDLTEYA